MIPEPPLVVKAFTVVSAVLFVLLAVYILATDARRSWSGAVFFGTVGLVVLGYYAARWWYQRHHV